MQSSFGHISFFLPSSIAFIFLLILFSTSFRFLSTISTYSLKLESFAIGNTSSAILFANMDLLSIFLEERHVSSANDEIRHTHKSLNLINSVASILSHEWIISKLLGLLLRQSYPDFHYRSSKDFSAEFDTFEHIYSDVP